MGSGKKYMYCTVCGAPFYRRASRPGKSLCMVHAVANMAENARQLNTHTGPYWATWLGAMTDAIARLNGEAIADSVPDGLDVAAGQLTTSGVPRARGRGPGSG